MAYTGGGGYVFLTCSGEEEEERKQLTPQKYSFPHKKSPPKKNVACYVPDTTFIIVNENTLLLWLWTIYFWLKSAKKPVRLISIWY